MTDYTSIDTAALTYEDAIEDEAFNKKPSDYFEYVALDASIIQSIIQDFGIDEAGEAIMYIADFCANGTEPDYTSMSTTAIKIVVRSVISNHEKRMMSEYLRHYRQFVKAQAKKQAEVQQNMDSSSSIVQV